MTIYKNVLWYIKLIKKKPAQATKDVLKFINLSNISNNVANLDPLIRTEIMKFITILYIMYFQNFISTLKCFLLSEISKNYIYTYDVDFFYWFARCFIFIAFLN